MMLPNRTPLLNLHVGAIAFALAFILPDEMENKDVLITTTIVVIMATIYIQGSTIKPILR